MPDAPGFIRLTSVSPGSASFSGVSQSPATAPTNGSGTLNGTVLDAQGNPIPQAQVTLIHRGKFEPRIMNADDNGAYSFAGVPPDQYMVEVLAPGFDPYVTVEVTIHAGETATAPRTALKVSSTTSSIDVTANPEQIAIAQVEEQEQQRVFGVFQNFYTSYIWNAEPMPTRVKYRLVFRTLLDPTSFLIIAGVAGAEHFNGTYPTYGPGITGYGKRYGAALADATSGRIIGSAILPSLLHQDPRYFYQGSGGVLSRSRHAVASAFVTRSDAGKTQFNFSHLGGSLASGALANLYHPEDSRGARLTFQTFGVNVFATMVGNLVREFVLRSLEPSVPIFANGKH